MSNFDPYHKWLGIPPSEQPPNHYRLLGIECFEADPDVIEAAADQRMAFVQEWAAGDHVEVSQAILNQLAHARVVLTNPRKKSEYDAEIRAVSIQPVLPGVEGFRKRLLIQSGVAMLIIVVAAATWVTLLRDSDPAVATINEIADEDHSETQTTTRHEAELATGGSVPSDQIADTQQDDSIANPTVETAAIVSTRLEQSPTLSSQDEPQKSPSKSPLTDEASATASTIQKSSIPHMLPKPKEGIPSQAVGTEAYQELWRQVLPQLSSRDYAAVEARLRDAHSDQSFQNSKALISADLSDVAFLKSRFVDLRKAIERKQPEENISLGGIGGLKFVRFDRERDSIIATVGNTKIERVVPVKEMTTNDFSAILGSDVASAREWRYFFGISHLIDESGDVTKAIKIFRDPLVADVSSPQWANRLNAKLKELNLDADGNPIPLENLSGIWRSELGELFSFNDDGKTITITLHQPRRSATKLALTGLEATVIRHDAGFVVQSWAESFRGTSSNRKWKMNGTFAQNTDNSLIIFTDTLHFKTGRLMKKLGSRYVWRKVAKK